MFWTIFNKLQLSLDMLRPYTGCLYGFAGDQVVVRGHLELKTTFNDGNASRTENIRYLVVNAPSAYNVLLGKPTLNMLGAVPSTRHIKMKLPDLAGKVITIKLDQKEAKRCYENNLKMKRGVFMVITRPPHSEEVAPPEINNIEIALAEAEIARAKIARESRPEPVGDVGEREIGGKVSKLGSTLDQTAQDGSVMVRPVYQRVEERHIADLEELFTTIVKYRLKLDLEKRVFEIEAKKFMGFLFTERGMDVNPEGCALTTCIAVLSGFASAGGEGDLPYQECKEAFIRLKEYLARPTVLCKPRPSTLLSLHLAVIDQTISSVLVQKLDQLQKLICFVSKVCQGPEE